MEGVRFLSKTPIAKKYLGAYAEKLTEVDPIAVKVAFALILDVIAVPI